MTKSRKAPPSRSRYALPRATNILRGLSSLLSDRQRATRRTAFYNCLAKPRNARRNIDTVRYILRDPNRILHSAILTYHIYTSILFQYNIYTKKSL